MHVPPFDPGRFAADSVAYRVDVDGGRCRNCGVPRADSQPPASGHGAGPATGPATGRLPRAWRFDPLTGLLNRAATEERLHEALLVDPADTLVVLIDLDGFRFVNEAHGTDAGDAVLEEVARRLSLAVRPEDAIGRYEADAFVVVCRGASAAAAALITGRLAGELTGEVVFDSGTWPVRATIGTAQPDPGEDPASVVARAGRVVTECRRL